MHIFLSILQIAKICIPWTKQNINPIIKLVKLHGKCAFGWLLYDFWINVYLYTLNRLHRVNGKDLNSCLSFQRFNNGYLYSALSLIKMPKAAHIDKFYYCDMVYSCLWTANMSKFLYWTLSWAHLSVFFYFFIYI